MRYKPDYANCPGTTLKEILRNKKISLPEFALLSGISEKTINEIIDGTGVIYPDIAEKLEVALGTTASFWIRRETFYREQLKNLNK